MVTRSPAVTGLSLSLPYAGVAATVSHAGAWNPRSRGNELVQHRRQSGQILDLAGGDRIGPLVEPVDPDALQPELVRRRDVVEEAGGDVRVAVAIGMRTREELRPVAVSRLVGADLGGDDRLVERKADPGLRGGDEVAVGVREDGEPPPAPACLLQRTRHLRKRRPGGQRPGESVVLAVGQLEVLAV